ncbi:MAG: M48 family metallopeptidase [Micavibrio sp.]|nr:M48 family metallopeptidase [Micavibrio sp.]
MDLPTHIIVKNSARARRLALRLDPKDRAFHLVVPKGVSMRRAAAFAEEHASWMRDRLNELPKQVAFDDGAVIPVLGKNRVIRIDYDEGLKRTDITISHTHILVSTNQSDPSARIKRFLKALAKDELEALSREKASIIGKKVKAVTVRDTKSRWGSCSHDGNLSYSWRLIFAPYESFDYVVAHEVAHLKHLDHSTAFWNICRALSDNFIDGQYWMREHGQELMRYG